jgi:hypothetical protein
MCCDLQAELKNDPQFHTEVEQAMTVDATATILSPSCSHQICPHQKKAWQVCSSVKTIMISLFDVDGIVHKVFVPLRQRVNHQFYLNVLKQMYDSLRQKLQEK